MGFYKFLMIIEYQTLSYLEAFNKIFLIFQFASSLSEARFVLLYF